MHPIFFRLDDLTIYTYGFLMAISFVVGILLARYEAGRLGEDQDEIINLSFYILIAAIAGSRLFYVATNPEAFLQYPLEILKIWKGGLVFYGGFITALIVGLIYLKKKGMPIWKTADIIAPSLALGYCIARLGCFAAGCCYGKPSDLLWAVTFTHPDTLAPIGISLHPTQLYSSITSLAIFGFLYLLRYRKRFDGQLFWIYVLLYGVSRLFIEIFRGDFRGVLIFEILSVSQTVGGIMAAVAIVMLILLGRQLHEK